MKTHRGIVPLARIERGIEKSTRPGHSDICALVVTHNPDETFAECVKRLVEQVGALVVVDNHSAPDRLASTRDSALPLGAHLILNGENVGIGAALNQGVRHAREAGNRWVLALDQDTIPSSTMVADLVAAWDACPFRDTVGIIGSRGARAQAASDCAGALWDETDVVITSGSLFSLAAFERVGPFREDFLIDYVDFEWCLRLRSHGYRVLLASRPTMTHSIGRPRAHTFFARTVVAFHHPPWRRYYIARNRMLVWRQYLRQEPRFVLRDAAYFPKEMAIIMLCEDARWQNLRNALLGLWDGWRKDTGRRARAKPDAPW